MKPFNQLILASMMATILVGCNDNDNDNSSEEMDYSQLRVLHASPDAPAVNVWLDGQPALEGVDYAMSSGAITVASGAHTVQVDAILADGSTTTVIPEIELALEPNVEYNVIATGKVAADAGTPMAFGPQIVSRDSLMPEGARVQVMHSSPDAPMVDVFITAPGADLSAATPFADNVEYPMATDAIEVPAGDYQIRITAPDDASMVYFDSGTVAVPAGADWFAAAVTNTGTGSSPVDVLVDTGEGYLLVDDMSAGAAIRAVHTISDAPGVDVWINGDAPAMDSPLYNLMYKYSTDYLQVPGAEYTFNVAVSGSDPVAVVDALTLEGELMSGQAYSAIAIGNLSDMVDNDELYLVEDNNTRRVATEAKLRVIHASTLAGNVDIYVSADATISDDDVKISNVPYKGDTMVLSVMPGMAYAIVTPVDTSTVAIGPAELALEGGTLTTLVAIDDPSSATSVSVISLDD
ncbi:DUF4397 domain-containing protein [Echinimonas agarilytica]|uniref:DUF4397 domain-containing protein n=1 Tax=Echinimonas agarilytica TaxID=1215918 RepID=A0AA41W3U9_9GAMM|nr:DUF4397 domain-containing protein [Echinimonas agarilytica]MCM2678315.1 DUF4397 domain-containing protein [Echinimonas agarilytica]